MLSFGTGPEALARILENQGFLEAKRIKLLCPGYNVKGAVNIASNLLQQPLEFRKIQGINCLAIAEHEPDEKAPHLTENPDFIPEAPKLKRAAQ